jgi:hypothetical protein
MLKEAMGIHNLFTGHILLLLYLSKPMPVISIDVSRFYSFGSSFGDTKLSKNDDGSSGSLDISISFPYFDKNHDKLFVSIPAF